MLKLVPKSKMGINLIAMLFMRIQAAEKVKLKKLIW